MELTDHDKEILQAVIDGKEIEYRKINGVWDTISNTEVLACLAVSLGDNLRIKPETIMIGDMEVARAIEQAVLQSQEYTSAIGEAGQAYMDSFKYAHPLPVQFRWSELWEVMYAAANQHSKALIKISGGNYE